MTKVRLLPHRMADIDSMDAGPWLFRYGDGEAREAPQCIPDFDYGVPLQFGFNVSVDLACVYKDTGLDESGIVGIYASLDCQSSDLRLTTTIEAVVEERGIWLAADRGTLSGSIELSRGLVTLSGGSTTAGDAPIRPGSRLLAHPAETIVLEGSLSRFPVESMKFVDVGRPRHAPWFLDTSYEDLSEPFLGAVRLIVNSDHPAGKAALERTRTSENAMIRSALRVDVARQLFSVLARDDRVETTADVPEDSIVGVASAMAESALAMDLQSALRLSREDPVYFEQRLQDAYRYLEV